jgi:RNA-directed DNA polymerase
MRRAKRLYERIVRWENLQLAFCKAARGRRDRPAVQRFADDLEEELSRMMRGLIEGDYPVGRFCQFVIYDPKERVITAPCFGERVLHHAVMNVLEPVLDEWLIDDTYACRRGRGRETAVLRARHFSAGRGWYLQLDVRKYFDSIPHARLSGMLERRIADVPLLELLQRIIGSFRGELGKGVPIGSLTSQHFANLYLGALDRFVKESLRVRGYVRYMDDLVLWGDTRSGLESLHGSVDAFLREELGLQFKPSQVRAVGSGIPFLGCRVYGDHVELSRRSKRRWRRRLRVLERAERLGMLTEAELRERVVSLTAFAKAAGAKSWRFRSRVLQSLAVNGPK